MKILFTGGDPLLPRKCVGNGDESLAYQTAEAVSAASDGGAPSGALAASADHADPGKVKAWIQGK